MKALTFLGERDGPDSLEKVAARRPIIGTGERPKELLEMANRRSWYIEGRDGEKPSVSITRAKLGERNLWRVEAPLDPVMGGAIPGISKERRPPAAFLEEADEATPVNGHRPDWADALFMPRRAVIDHPPTMRRFNGRRVRPLWVFGADNRWQFHDASWPWGLVGRIFNNEGYSGTGALVGNRLVITAGHMVPWSSSSWWMKFVPAYYDGQSLHGAGVESYVSDARGYDTGGNVTGYDWAICRLYEPLGHSLGYFGYNGFSDSWEDQPWWSIIGYPGAVANAQRPSFQGGITVGDTDSDSNGGEELESDTADITPGDSGGPMFGWWGNDPRIVGVVSGEEEYSFLGITFDQDNIMAAGSGFTNLISWGRSNWT